MPGLNCTSARLSMPQHASACLCTSRASSGLLPVAASWRCRRRWLRRGGGPALGCVRPVSQHARQPRRHKLCRPAALVHPEVGLPWEDPQLQLTPRRPRQRRAAAAATRRPCCRRCRRRRRPRLSCCCRCRRRSCLGQQAVVLAQQAAAGLQDQLREGGRRGEVVLQRCVGGSGGTTAQTADVAATSGDAPRGPAVRQPSPCQAHAPAGPRLDSPREQARTWSPSSSRRGTWLARSASSKCRFACSTQLSPPSGGDTPT